MANRYADVPSRKDAMNKGSRGLSKRALIGAAASFAVALAVAIGISWAFSGGGSHSHPRPTHVADPPVTTAPYPDRR